MSDQRSIPSGLRLTYNVAGALAIFWIFWVLSRHVYLVLTLDTFFQLLITYLYQSGLNDPYGIPCSLSPPANNSLSGQLSTAAIQKESISRKPTCKPSGSRTEISNSSTRRKVEHNGDLAKDTEGAQELAPRDTLQAVATAVGWREDPIWYTKCLESLRKSQTCELVVAGIDGDEIEDEQMIGIFNQVFPEGLIIRLPRSCSKVLEDRNFSGRLNDGEEDDREAMAYLHCFVDMYTNDRLIREMVPPRTNGCIQRAICIVQPHKSKKDILFTAMVFGAYLARRLKIEVIFSTDSDTVLHPDAIDNVVRKVHSDARIGGVSGHMQFFHERPTCISKLASAYYWYQQDVAKIQGAMFGFNECQPGPCAGFRVAALESILPSWIGQTVCGQEMVSNEDRHFTTQLLARDYSVVHVPDAVVETDTPNTFSKWTKQQVRWMRGTMVETTAYPHMARRMHPWVIYTIAKTRLLPLVTFAAVARTTYTGQLPAFVGSGSHLVADFFLSAVMQTAFLLIARPNGVGARRLDLLWALPSLVWFFLWFPAIQVWSLLTVFDGSWGTPMRATGEGVQDKAAVPRESVFARLRRVPWDMVFMSLWALLVAVALGRLSGLNPADCLQ